MGRHEVGALLAWATGTGLVAAVPHVVELPPVLAAALPWITGVGVIITTAIGILIGTTKALTKFTTERTALVEAQAKLVEARAKLRRTRRMQQPRGRQQQGKAAPR